MALLKAPEVRAMSPEDRRKKLTELRGELMNERGVAAMGGSPASPGKIRQIRAAIARILTIENQEIAGHVQYAQGEKPRLATPRPAPKPVPEVAVLPLRSQQGRVQQRRAIAENRVAAEAAMARKTAANKAQKKAAPKKPAAHKAAEHKAPAKKSEASKPKTAPAAKAKTAKHKEA
jgi:large subunit ribosomal protein L29